MPYCTHRGYVDRAYLQMQGLRVATTEAEMTERVRVEIDGMSCGHCVNGVEQALKGMSGVQVEQVSIGSAVIAYDPGVVEAEAIKEAIAEEGYQVRSMAGAP